MRKAPDYTQHRVCTKRVSKWTKLLMKTNGNGSILTLYRHCFEMLIKFKILNDKQISNIDRFVGARILCMCTMPRLFACFSILSQTKCHTSNFPCSIQLNLPYIKYGVQCVMCIIYLKSLDWSNKWGSSCMWLFTHLFNIIIVCWGVSVGCGCK